MKFAVVFAAVLAVSSAQFNPFGQPQRVYRPVSSTPRPIVNRVASSDQSAAIINFDNEINPDGSYRYGFQSDNGISVQADGTPRDFGGNPPLIPVVSQGSYSYTSPEGVPVSVSYVADEYGFQPQGDVLPTPHPVPQAILRALEYNAKNAPQKK